MIEDIDKSKEELLEEIRSLRKEIECMKRHSKDLDDCVAKGREYLKDQLKLAARVHRTLLPEPFENDRIKVDMKYYPLEEIGGDYSQVRFAGENICYITTSDVTGHGIGSAILATRISSEVRRFILEGLDPGQIVSALNSFIMEFFINTNLYPSFFAARIDFNKKTLTWSGAGHPCPLILRKDSDEVIYMKSRNPIIGIDENMVSDEHEDMIDIMPGDRLLFYSDGIIDTTNTDGEVLGINGLAGIAQDSMSLDFSDMTLYIHDKVNEYRCGPQKDDELLISAEIV